MLKIAAWLGDLGSGTGWPFNHVPRLFARSGNYTSSFSVDVLCMDDETIGEGAQGNS